MFMLVMPKNQRSERITGLASKNLKNCILLTDFYTELNRYHHNA